MDPAVIKKDEEGPRKRRFMPKAPPRRTPKPEVKNEVIVEDDADQARDLLKRFNDGLTRAKPKTEKKVAATQIAFGYGGASTTIRSYGPSRVASVNRNQDSASNGGKFPTAPIGEKEYKEPWDYYTYYPAILPLRRPYSGNPECLDEEEFGLASETTTYDELSTNPAKELGLMEENPEGSMFFMQLPPTMPLLKTSATTDGQDQTTSTPKSGGSSTMQKSCTINELPAGFMGKMLVYRSGAVKLTLGDTLYDVSAGIDCVFAQDAVAVNTAEKHCCVIGELNKRAIVTPDKLKDYKFLFLVSNERRKMSSSNGKKNLMIFYVTVIIVLKTLNFISQKLMNTS